MAWHAAMLRIHASLVDVMDHAGLAASVGLAETVYGVSANVILDSACRAITSWDIITSCIKSWVFGTIIAVVSTISLHGYVTDCLSVIHTLDVSHALLCKRCSCATATPSAQFGLMGPQHAGVFLPAAFCASSVSEHEHGVVCPGFILGK